MTVCALQKDELLTLMANEIENDDAFIRIDKSSQKHEGADGSLTSKSLYLGSFALYDECF